MAEKEYSIDQQIKLRQEKDMAEQQRQASSQRDGIFRKTDLGIMGDNSCNIDVDPEFSGVRDRRVEELDDEIRSNIRKKLGIPERPPVVNNAPEEDPEGVGGGFQDEEMYETE